MKNMYHFFTFQFFLLIFISSGWSQTAVDFNVLDCSGVNRHLFTELDAGKIVVMSMVHPCGSCVAPTKSAIDVVNSFATSNPGRVLFYLTDDDGGTNCTSLSSWANQYAISGVPIISNTSLKQSDFGGSGMPKIVMIAGASHSVLFMQDNGLNAVNLRNAISSALAANGIEEKLSPSDITVYPNPLSNQLNIGLNLKKSTIVCVQLFDILGVNVMQLNGQEIKSGGDVISLNISQLSQGCYFVKVLVNSQVSITKISHVN